VGQAVSTLPIDKIAQDDAKIKLYIFICKLVYHVL